MDYWPESKLALRAGLTRRAASSTLTIQFPMGVVKQIMRFSLIVSAGSAFLAGIAIAQQTADQAEAGRAAAEFKSYCGNSVVLWGKSLCGGLIFVDPASRSALASLKPPVGQFTAAGSMWAGKLPQDIPVANTSISLGGERFAEMALPLPADPVERRILLAHESFHRIQPELGFKGQEADNGHLDTKDGRILGRLEAAALVAALTRKDWRSAALDALSFRAARLAKFKNAATAEGELLVNEGLAEYTGIKVGAGTSARTYAVERLDSVSTRPSLIRSFGYVVGPAYGLLLDRARQPWRREALKRVALPDLLTRAVGTSKAPAPMTSYGAAKIIREESARDEKNQQRRRLLTKALVDGLTVTFPLIKMEIDFNPNALFSLGDQGTVYSGGTTIRDAWGTLKVEGDVLISPDWKFARVPGGGISDASTLSGPGWTAKLANGYSTVKGARAGDRLVQAKARP